MFKWRSSLAGILLLGAQFPVASGQETAPPAATATQQPAALARPRIGVALEGGGALGLAHVGVLQWFEAHRIPVDYIAGTSMGGLVGSLYATGLSPTEMNKFVQDINWNRALNNETPYRALSFRRKEDRTAYPTRLEFGLKDGVSFPSGFNSGHQVGLILDRIALPYSEMNSFNELPTPFRCVATDLVTGKPKVFSSGSLSEALRSTMSLPGIFSPVRDDDQLYVDGGLLENLPVDVVRKMGADIVIAIHLEVKPYNANQPLSAFGVLGQSVSVVIAANELASMQRADVLVPVHSEDYTSTDYEAIDALIRLGYQGAEERGKLLERFALTESEWKDYIAQREAKRRPAPVPEFVEVEGPAPVIAQGIQKALANDIGKPVDYTSLNRQMTDVTGLGRFSRAGFQLIEKDGKNGLLIHVDDKDYAPPVVNPIILIDGSDYNNVRFSLGARITLFDLGGFGSEWRNDVIGGALYGVQSEYYHPLYWKSPLFVAPRIFANSLPIDVYSNDNRVAEYRQRQEGGGFDVGLAFDRFSELRVGYQIEHLSLTREIGIPDFVNDSGRQSFARLQFIEDRLDNPTVPRSGWYAKYGLRYYDANLDSSENFPWTQLQTKFFKRITRPGSAFILASGGTTFDYQHTGTLPLFSLGGPTGLAAYGTNELLTNQYFLVRPGYEHRLKELSPIFGGSITLFAMYEGGKAYKPLNPLTPTEDLITRYSQDVNGGVIFNTFLGPIIFGGAVGDHDHHKFYFQLGQYF
jgi:NTE family protein